MPGAALRCDARHRLEVFLIDTEVSERNASFDADNFS
jgi:hypothetical protein